MDAESSAAGYRLLLEVNNAIISNLTRESLFRAIAEALRKVVPPCARSSRSIEPYSTMRRTTSSARLR